MPADVTYQRSMSTFGQSARDLNLSLCCLSGAEIQAQVVNFCCPVKDEKLNDEK